MLMFIWTIWIDQIFLHRWQFFKTLTTHIACVILVAFCKKNFVENSEKLLWVNWPQRLLTTVQNLSRSHLIWNRTYEVLNHISGYTLNIFPKDTNCLYKGCSTMMEAVWSIASFPGQLYAATGSRQCLYPILRWAKIEIKAGPLWRFNTLSAQKILGRHKHVQGWHCSPPPSWCGSFSALRKHAYF